MRLLQRFPGYRMPGYDVPSRRGSGRGIEETDSSAVKLDLKMEPSVREAAMAVIDRAYGEGGTSGLKGKDPEIAPAEHLAELKTILGDVDLRSAINQVIREHKLANFQSIAAQESGSTDVNAVFNAYKYAGTLNAGVPRPDGKQAEDGYLWGRQETMKKFPEMFDKDNPQPLSAEAKKFWMEAGLSYEAGLYTEGMVRYLGPSLMNEPEKALTAILRNPEYREDKESARLNLINALGDIPSLEVLDEKLEKTMRSVMRKLELLPENASSEEMLSSMAHIYGLDPKKYLEDDLADAKKEGAKEVKTAKELEDLKVKQTIATLKELIGPFTADK